MSSLPDPSQFETVEPSTPRSPWSIADLVVFGVFFFLVVLLLPLGIVRVWRIFSPDMQLTDVPPSAQILMQGLIDVSTLGFIAFLIKIVHGQSFIETIHWHRNRQFRTGFLVTTGALLAISVLVVSSLFPSGEAPIERMLSSTTAISFFVILGIAVAPIVEEVMFRGFLFKVISDLRGSNAAVVVTALLFGGLHVLQLWGNWVAVALIFVVGYILSFVRQRSNSLIPSFIIHTSYNCMLFGAFALSSLLQKSAH
jgi:membrane protease YdiL (CAAX protease family)